MNIIFGKEKETLESSDVDLDTLKDQYTVLPLDKVKYAPNGEVFQTWCLLSAEKQSMLSEAPHLPSLTKLHEDLMAQYYKKNWDFCLEAIANLRGHFAGELDSFYDILESRINEYKTLMLDESWDGVFYNETTDSTA